MVDLQNYICLTCRVSLLPLKWITHWSKGNWNYSYSSCQASPPLGSTQDETARWSAQKWQVLWVGHWVYLKVQPYKKSIYSSSPFQKLTAKYYGPFQIIRRVGTEAYTWLLPPTMKIDHTVHVSFRKKYYEVPDQICLSTVNWYCQSSLYQAWIYSGEKDDEEKIGQFPRL